MSDMIYSTNFFFKVARRNFTYRLFGVYVLSLIRGVDSLAFYRMDDKTARIVSRWIDRLAWEKDIMRFAAGLAGLGLLTLGGVADAQVGKGLSGPHYNLNIIGVPKDKSVPDMTGSNRHTIFVPLESGEDVSRKVKIYFEPNLAEPTKFRVSDGNATDDNEATVLVPFEYCDDYVAGCEELLSYNVYAVGLGKPNGGAIVTAECEYSEDVVDTDGTEGLECEDTLLMGSFDIGRTTGKPKRENITDVFRATGCLDIAGEEGICDAGDLEFRDLWIFNIEELLEYFWDYDNNGLKLMQTRFYPTTSGYIGYR